MMSADSSSKSAVAPVSVVIPCYRCASTIARAVASVLAQTLPVAEILLVDDASGDGTLEALEDIRRRHGAVAVRVLAAPVNLGAGEARNLGWNAASQPWVAFLDADDAWHPRKIEIQYGWLLQHPGVVLCAHQTVVTQDADWPLPEAIVGATGTFGTLGQRIRPARLPFSNVIPTRSVMLRRDLPCRFYPGKRYSEDFALWLKIVLSNLPAYKLPLPLACSFRPEFSGGGLSASLWRAEKGELDTLRIMRRERLIGLGTLLMATLWSLVKFVRRVVLRRIVDVIRIPRATAGVRAGRGE